MSAPAQVTEAHLELAKTALFSRDKAGRLLTAPMAAQLIANSEARTIAAAVAPLEARIKSDEELFHDIRMKLTASCGDPYKLHDEALDAIIAERDQLRAEVERLKRDYDYDHKCLYEVRERCELWKQRAERAEAELKAEQDNSAINEIELRVSRAIVSKIWVQLGSPTYEQLKGRSIYDLIDELKAELAKERARLDWLMAGGVCMVQHTGGFHVSRLHAPVSRAAIDDAMKEETK